jgi:polar amino acid transport system substrate-binding protein
MLIASVLGPISTTILTPALPLVENYFDSNAYSLQQVMNFNLASIAISGIVYAVLSEYFGRRPIFLLGILLFSLGAFLSYFANSLGYLIIFQIIQCCGIGVGVLTSPVIGDIYRDAKAVKLISTLGIFAPIIIYLSPLIGGYITQYLGWSFIFLMQFIIGICFFISLYFGFPETISFNNSHSFKEQIKICVITLKDISFIRVMLMMCLAFSGLWVYHITAPFVFIQQFNLSPAEYGIYPIVSVSGIILGNIFINRIANILSHKSLLKIGAFIALCGTFLLLLLTIFSYHHPLGFAICMAIYYFGCASIFSIGLVSAIDSTVYGKGYRVALIRGGQFMMASIIGSMCSFFYTTSFLFVGFVILICIIIVNIISWK